MPDDDDTPRDKLPQPRLKVGTDPRGVKIPTPAKGIQERGGGRGSASHDRRQPRLTPSYIKQELTRRVDLMNRGTPVPEFDHEEFTPITVIAIVRAELKDDISEIKKDQKDGFARIEQIINGMRADMNALMQQIINQLMAIVSSEFNTKQHRDKTEVNDKSFSVRARWLNVGKVVGFVASGVGLAAIGNLLLQARC